MQERGLSTVAINSTTPRISYKSKYVRGKEKQKAKSKKDKRKEKTQRKQNGNPHVLVFRPCAPAECDFDLPPRDVLALELLLAPAPALGTGIGPPFPFKLTFAAVAAA